MLWQLVESTTNGKLVDAKARKACGRPVPCVAVINASRDTCPLSCPNRGECYAEGSHNASNWTKIGTGERGTDWISMLEFIAGLPSGSLLRYGVQGDLPGDNDRLDHDKCMQLAHAIVDAGVDAWLYTHYPVLNSPNATHNANTIRAMRALGVAVNCSANSPEHAQQILETGVAPVAVVLPPEAPRITRLRGGATVKACPAQVGDKMGVSVDCAQCRLCLKTQRTSVVGLYAHGRGAKQVAQRSRANTL